MEANENLTSPPLMRIFNIEAGVQSKGEKVGAMGLEPQVESSQHLTDVNPNDGDRAHDVILLVVKSFNN